MQELAAIVLFSWIPLVLVIFAVLPPRRAVIVTFLLGYLFLPETQYPVSVLPDFSKTTVTSYALVLAILIFDNNRLSRFRLSWLDVPVLLLCSVDIPTSLLNGLGAYDGVTRSLAQCISIAIPWFVGRLYFNDLEGLRELAAGIFISGLLYMPLCLLEIQISPQLHRMVYGEHAHQFIQTIRYGGYRPTVFLGHGLHVGMWMTWATLCGIWLFWTRSLTTLFGIPLYLLIAPLAVTTVLCKSTGALVLLAMGCGLLAWVKLARPSWSAWPIHLLVLCVLLYLGVRITGVWHGAQLIELAGSIFGSERAQSLNFRIMNERILTDHAMRQPLFGWGAWNRNRPADLRVITDSQWIIILGVNGLAGLVGFVGMLIGPPLLIARRVSTRLWTHPAVSAVPLFAVIAILTMVDLLLNAGYAPALRAAFGGLAGFQLVRGAPAASWEAMVARMRAAAQDQEPPETPAQRKTRRRKTTQAGRKGSTGISFDWPQK